MTLYVKVSSKILLVYSFSLSEVLKFKNISVLMAPLNFWLLLIHHSL